MKCSAPLKRVMASKLANESWHGTENLSLICRVLKAGCRRKNANSEFRPNLRGHETLHGFALDTVGKLVVDLGIIFV